MLLYILSFPSPVHFSVPLLPCHWKYFIQTGYLSKNEFVLPLSHKWCHCVCTINAIYSIEQKEILESTTMYDDMFLSIRNGWHKNSRILFTVGMQGNYFSIIILFWFGFQLVRNFYFQQQMFFIKAQHSVKPKHQANVNPTLLMKSIVKIS